MELINILMKKKASMTERDDEGRHVALRAVARGVEPKVLSCLERWSKKQGAALFGPDDHDENREGALILAAKRGSIKLVRHLLTRILNRGCLFYRSNNPMRVLRAAIEVGKTERTVLYLLRAFKDYDDEEDSEPRAPEDPTGKVFTDYYDLAGIITFSSLLRAAFDNNMLEAALFLGTYAPKRLWLCWQQQKMTFGENAERDKIRAFKKIDAFAKEVQAAVINDRKPCLLLMARARRKKDKTKKSTKTNNKKSITTTARDPLVDVPDDIFRRIAAFAFTSLQQIEDALRQEQDLHERELICYQCGTRHAPFGCLSTEIDLYDQLSEGYH